MSFLRYSMSKNVVTLKDFLLTFHSNHRSISHRFRDRQRFQSKIARVFNAPLKAFPFELGIGAKGQKTRATGLSEGPKSFKIGLVIYTQYQHVTDRQTDSHLSTAKTVLACVARVTNEDTRKHMDILNI